MKIARWGNSLAVRLPREVAERAALREGEEIELSVEDGAVILRRRAWRYDLDELVSGITEENRHEEQEWGEPRGREVW